MSAESVVMSDRPPLARGRAVAAVGRCVATSLGLLLRREVTQPRTDVGSVIEFADGSHGRVYRETRVGRPPAGAPAVLVVEFRLRWVRGHLHGLFRLESILNTPLFVGFPGFVSKLWLAHDEQGRYRGFYQWSDAGLADAYARALWWVLALVSVRESIHYVVLPATCRDDALSHPERLATPAGSVAAGAWWRPVAVRRPA